MKAVEHPRTYKTHITEEKLDIGSETLCGLTLPTSPGSIMGDGVMCRNCIRSAASR